MSELITNFFESAGAFSLKVPSGPVWVPYWVPFTTTVAPATGEPSFESVTLPVITLVWAKAAVENKAKNRYNIPLASVFKFIKQAFS
ncbi:MAG: hypothetical protein ACOYU6_04735 [Bacteroidota bacterium]